MSKLLQQQQRLNGFVDSKSVQLAFNWTPFVGHRTVEERRTTNGRRTDDERRTTNGRRTTDDDGRTTTEQRQ